MLSGGVHGGLRDANGACFPVFPRVSLCFPRLATAPSSAEEGEGVGKFLSDTAAQWRNLSVEVRSVRSMLEEVISNWEKYSSTVAGLQAWLEDGEKMLNQPENAKRVWTPG